jgi:hypothetical protein
MTIIMFGLQKQKFEHTQIAALTFSITTVSITTVS